MKLDVLNLFRVNKANTEAQTKQTQANNSVVQDDSRDLSTLPECYGRAQVVIDSKSSLSHRYNLGKFLKELNQIFLDNDRKREFQELFKNLNKVDLEVASDHLENIRTYLAGNSNYTTHIIQKGYFYTKEGAQAFKEMAKIFESKSKPGYVSELSTRLGSYTPEAVLTLKNRGLLTAKDMRNSNYMNKIAQMTDEQYSKHLEDGQKAIEKTGMTYEELLAKFKDEIQQLNLDAFSLGVFNNNCGQRGIIASQYEMFNFMKNSSVLENREIIHLLSKIDNDNLEDYKQIVNKLETYPELGKFEAEQILSNAYNDKARALLFEMLQIENMPIDTISEQLYHYNNALNKNEEQAKEIEENIRNNPLVNAISAIKKADFDFNSQIKPTSLDIHNIKPSSLVLVHMTDYEPQDGLILSPKDKFEGSRNSVHFTLNHPVEAHRNGDWDSKKYAIIMPFEATVNANKQGKFIEGMPNDIYTNGSVTIPGGSIILKENTDLKNGEIKISNHPMIDDVKIIETSVKPHEIAPAVIEKMGYDYHKGSGVMGLFSEGRKKDKDIDSVCNNYNSWVEFCNSQGIKANRHTGSIGFVLETTIENIGALAKRNSWIHKEFDGTKINVKNHMLECLDYAKDLARKGYFSYLDLDAFMEIISKAKTPKDALKEMKEKLQIKPTLESTEFYPCSGIMPLEIYQKWYNSENDPNGLREYLQRELKYRY